MIQVRILDESQRTDPVAFYRFRLADGSWPNAWFRVAVDIARVWLTDGRAIFAGPEAPVVRVLPAPPHEADDAVVRHGVLEEEVAYLERTYCGPNAA